MIEMYVQLQTYGPDFGPNDCPRMRIKIWQDGDWLRTERTVEIRGAIIALRLNQAESVAHLLAQASLSLAAQEGSPMGNLIPL